MSEPNLVTYHAEVVVPCERFNTDMWPMDETKRRMAMSIARQLIDDDAIQILPHRNLVDQDAAVICHVYRGFINVEVPEVQKT